MKLKEVYRALVNQVKIGLIGTDFEEVEFTTTDIKEGFDRPSFFLEIDDTKTELITPSRIKRTIPVNLYYFPEDLTKHKIELMEVQSFLESILFQPIVIEESKIQIEDLDFERPSGVLKANFEISIIEENKTENDSEFMETLDYE